MVSVIELDKPLFSQTRSIVHHLKITVNIILENQTTRHYMICYYMLIGRLWITFKQGWME